MILNCIIYIYTHKFHVSRYVFYTVSILLPSHACLAAGFYINCTPPLEETSNHPNKERHKETQIQKQTNKHTSKLPNNLPTKQTSKVSNFYIEFWVLNMVLVRKGERGRCLFQGTDCDPKRWKPNFFKKKTAKVWGPKSKAKSNNQHTCFVLT